MNWSQNEWLMVAITLVIYRLALWIQQRSGILLLNPTLLSILFILAGLKGLNLEYKDFEKGTHPLFFMLKPAIVALGVPLYLYWDSLRKQLIPILISQFAGCLAGILSVVGTAHFLGAPDKLIISLAPKSASSPIAYEICAQTGGIPSLTAGLALTVGIFGAMFGYRILNLSGVKNPASQSLAIGAASHGIGTARSMQISPRFGALSTLGMILTGVCTAFLTPLVLRWLGYF